MNDFSWNSTPSSPGRQMFLSEQGSSNDLDVPSDQSRKRFPRGIKATAKAVIGNKIFGSRSNRYGQFSTLYSAGTRLWHRLEMRAFPPTSQFRLFITVFASSTVSLCIHARLSYLTLYFRNRLVQSDWISRQPRSCRYALALQSHSSRFIHAAKPMP